MRQILPLKTSALLLIAVLACSQIMAQEITEYSAPLAPPPPVKSTTYNAHFSSLNISNSPGKPALPKYSVTFLLPAQTDLSQVIFSLEGGQIFTLPGTFSVAPAPPVAVNGKEVWPANASIVDGRDMAVYGRGEFYPGNWVSQPQFGRAGRYQLAEVHVSPYRYNPLTGKLQMISGGHLVAHVVARPNPRLAPSDAPLPAAIEASLRQRLKGLVANFSEGIQAYPQPMASLAASPAPATYLILSTDAIRTGSTRLGAFADSKLKRWSVDLVTESGLYGRTGSTWQKVAGGWGGGLGDLAAERIRGWLKSNWTGLGIQDVLLIGNPDPTSGDVPMKLCRPRKDATDYPEAPTDFYYAELTGTWDLNGDGIYGDFTTDFGAGGADKYAELTVGRIPTYGKLGDLDPILDKSTQYENATDIAWRSNALLPMKPSDEFTPGYQLGEQIRTNFLLPRTWPSTRVYEESYGTSPEVFPCTYATTLNAWQSGNYGLVTWWTHGWDRGASDILTTENAALLSDQHPAFSFQCSCLNGTPETSDNLGYALLRHGCVGTVSATRVSWYCPGQTDFTGLTSTNASMAYQFSGQLLGAGLSAGKALDSLRTMMTIDADVWWMNALVFNLYGDPSLGLASRGDESVGISLNASAVTLSAGATFQFQANLGVTWSVLEAGGGSVNGSGLYTAPAVAGTYHVRATSVADASKQAEARVTVTGGGEFTDWVVFNSPSLTFNFIPGAPVSWVDIHYKTSRNDILQNYRMLQSGSAWGSTSAPQPGLQKGDVLTYFYTYAKPTGAVDSAWITRTVGSIAP